MDGNNAPRNWCEKIKAGGTLIVKPIGSGATLIAKNEAKVTSHFIETLLKYPFAVIGKAKNTTFDGSGQDFKLWTEKVKESLDAVKERTQTVQGFENLEIDNQKLEAFNEILQLQKEKMLKEIEALDQEKAKEIRSKMRSIASPVASKLEEVDKKNNNAILPRIMASIALSGVVDFMDILGFILENFPIDSSFSEGVGKVVADSRVVGPIAEMYDKLEIDKMVEGLAKFPILGDINEGFFKLAHSEYLSPVSSVIVSAIQSEAANFIFNSAIICNRAGSEIDLMSDYKSAHENKDEAIDVIKTAERKMLEEHFSKSASKIIELETKEQLRSLYLQDFLSKSHKLDEVFSSEFLSSKLKNEKGEDHALTCKEFIEKLINNRIVPISDDEQSLIKHNKTLFKEMVNAIEQNYYNKGANIPPELLDTKLQMFEEKILNKDGAVQRFLSAIKNDKFKDSIAGNVILEIQSKLNEASTAKDLGKLLLGFDSQTCDKIVGEIAKIEKLDEKILKIKTSLPPRELMEIARANASDSVTEKSRVAPRVL